MHRQQPGAVPLGLASALHVIGRLLAASAGWKSCHCEGLSVLGARESRGIYWPAPTQVIWMVSSTTAAVTSCATP